MEEYKMLIKEKLSHKKKPDVSEDKAPEGIGFYVIQKAINMKGVKVDRTEFLTKTLEGKVSPEDLKNAIENGTAEAKIPLSIIQDEAKSCINNIKGKSTCESAITGLPGGVLGICGGIIVDLIQFYANLIILIQKLVYLYGMKEISGYGEIKEKNKDAANVILIFIGAAMGTKGADNIVKIIMKMVQGTYIKQSGKFILFAKPLFYSIAKKVAKQIGLSISKKGFAKAAAKAVPLIGGGISAVLNYATFSPMANRLNRVLEKSYTGPFDENLVKQLEEKLKKKAI